MRGGEEEEGSGNFESEAKDQEVSARKKKKGSPETVKSSSGVSSPAYPAFLRFL